MFQELFSQSKTIFCCVESSTWRVIHRSIIFSAVKEGEEAYLAEVLKALQEKYLKKQSKVKLMLAWMSSKLACCGKTQENLDLLEDNKNKEDKKETDANLEENKDKEHLERNVKKDDKKEKKDHLEAATDKGNQEEEEDSIDIGKERNDEETEESLEDDKNNSEEKEREKQPAADDSLVAHLQELEDAHVQFARKSANTSNHEEVKREIQDMKNRVSDLKTDIVTGCSQ